MFYLIPLTLLHLRSRSPPPNPTPHLIHTRPLDLVIPRLRRGLINNISRRPSKLRPLALEPNVRDPRDVLVSVAKVVGEEEHQTLDLAEQRPANGDFLEFARLGELEGLHGVELFGGGKVDVVAVDEEVQGFGG